MKKKKKKKKFIKKQYKFRNDVKEMFYHAYDNYMINAFPKDELKPLSCTGYDSKKIIKKKNLKISKLGFHHN